jgi:hypothetical protein
MSQLRQYNKRPCRTISYNYTQRQSCIGSFERLNVTHARGDRQKQARTGRVFAFVPDPDYTCCTKKKCSSHFTDAKHISIKKAREPLYDKYMDREKMRRKLRDNWHLHLRLPDGTKCCKKMALKIYNCSSSLLYGNNRKRNRGEEPQSQGDANSKRTKIATSIASWFGLLKDTVCDVRVCFFLFSFFCFFFSINNQHVLNIALTFLFCTHTKGRLHAGWGLVSDRHALAFYGVCTLQ